MKYPHIVVRDGVWYPAGTEVPVGWPMKVELTDDVPEGALEPNIDEKKPENPKQGRKTKEV